MLAILPDPDFEISSININILFYRDIDYIPTKRKVGKCLQNKSDMIGIVKNPPMKYYIDLLIPETWNISISVCELSMNESEAINKVIKSDSKILNGFVIGLSGTLGAGKTHFVKNLLKTAEPGFEKQVQSPTFNICNVYTIGHLTVHHYDLYRVESEEELYEIGIWESIGSSAVFTCIEWIEQFPELMEKCDMILSIRIADNGERIYEIEKN